MILIPTLVFWISNPKSIFGEIWSEKVKLFALLENWETHAQYLEGSDSYSKVSFLKFQAYIRFWANLSRKC